jgi:integrase
MTQHLLKHPEQITYETVKQTITNLTGIDQLLAAMAYATGARVSELNQITKANLFLEPNGTYLFIHCPVLKKRDKKKHERKAIVRVDEDWLVEPILSAADKLKDTEIICPFNRTFIYRHLLKATGWNPHGFRHLRATHLRSVFGFDAYQLQKFFAWKTIEPSSFYVSLDSKEIEY